MSAEMIYKDTHTTEILDEGKYNKYHYIIISYGTHPCAYVEIEPEHPLYFECGANIEHNLSRINRINCHGGVTFTSKYGLGMNNTPIHRTGRWIGWDFSHHTDYFGGSMYNEFYRTDSGEIKPEHKKWTTAEILEDVHRVIHQLEGMRDE